jgi:hypothetical protein
MDLSVLQGINNVVPKVVTNLGISRSTNLIYISVDSRSLLVEKQSRNQSCFNTYNNID